MFTQSDSASSRAPRAPPQPELALAGGVGERERGHHLARDAMQGEARGATQRLQQRIVGRRHRHQRRLVTQAGRGLGGVAGRAPETDAAGDLVARHVADHQQIHTAFLAPSPD
jgi:hypothetical protein